ncbi:M56 family metallopeptidase [Winogradskyella algicola]|uniref:M56 family metallopeptidase n=1 Tax=Winogradskyella algicola TaxID=2575815 RepID=UPI0011098377|nr:M56 family metallopeptidase [Winogradskyella algicola]
MEYLLKASAAVCIFYICYQLLLKRETFFNHNRWFLIIGLVLALVFPLVVIPIYTPLETVASPEISFQTNSIAITSPSIITEKQFEWSSFLAIIYAIGFGILFLQFLFQFGSLIWLLIKNPKNKEGIYTYVTVNHKISPFSFFKWIVFNPKDFSNEELELILMHEKVHVNQMHSLDVLFSQLACVIFWFNPLVWFYKKEVHQNLEYIADRETQATTKNEKAYQHLLLKTSIHNTNISLSNNFYNSQIKNRIIMLHKSKSHQKKQWRYLLILPLLAGLLMSMNTEKVYVENASTIENPKEIIEFIITKNTTDSELNKIKDELKNKGITITFKRIKRNNNGEIRAVKIEAKSKNSSTNYQVSSDDEAIKPIKIVFDKENNSISIGKGDTIHKAHSYIIETEDGGKHKIHKTGKGNNVFVISKEKTNTKRGDTLYMVIDKNSNEKTIKKSKNIEVISGDDDEVEVIIENEGNDEDEIIVDGKKIKTVSDKGVEVIVEEKNGNNVWINNEDLNKEEDIIIIQNAYDDENMFITTSNGKDPLYIINDKEVSKDKFIKMKPKNIESVTVLKDKSAIEKYGDKAKNGVIIIKTKKD